MPDFVHLHNHTHYSLLDAACKPEQLIEAAKADGQTSIALTDHGVMFGCFEFYKKAKKAGIKPILGCEVYIATGSRFDMTARKAGNKKRNYYHLVLLAKNDIGYKNLMKLTTLGHTEGFYYKPRIDQELLLQYREGLVALSACLSGVVNAPLLEGDYERAKQSAIWYKEAFGEDFYIELQNHGLEGDKIVMEQAPRLARELGIKLICSNDCHYIKKEDAVAHNVLLNIKEVSSANSGQLDIYNLRYGVPEMYFKAKEEMAKIFADYPDAIENTNEVAEKCNVDLKSDIKMPVFPIPSDSKAESLEEYLEELTMEGLEKRYPVLNANILERVKFELDVIKSMGYAGYFLIVQDFIKAARDKQVRVGPGRGSAAGSIVAYALGIINVDPLKYDLLFERFLNPDRVSMPDIDIDFADDKRDVVIDYVREKYGNDSVAQIITFGTLSSRAVLADVGRVLGIPLATIRSITEKIPSVMGKVTPLTEAMDLPELRWVKESNDPKLKELIDYATTLEGLARNSSTHAAGVVIAPGNINDYVPLYKTSDSVMATQYTMKDLEDAGLLKMDFLGLKTLSIIENTLAQIKKNHGVDIDTEALDLHDQATFDLIGKGKTLAIFQFESEQMQESLKKLKPNDLEDLIAMNALYRPGPMDNIPEFIDRKQGRKSIEYLHPIMESALHKTYGVIVYQEQVMQLVGDIAGFTLAQADIMRRAMGKKDEKLMLEQKALFVDGALKNPVFIQGCISKVAEPQTLAEEIFDLILKFASYGFNKSHSCAYAYLAYQTAWLKTHYMAEFLAANMTAELHNQDKIVQLIDEARSFGITVMPPDVNRSFAIFTASDSKTVEFGLAGIKNVGIPAVDAIVEARSKGTFTSLFDFVKRVNLKLINRRTLEPLVCSGAFDSMQHGHRAQMFATIDSALEFAKRVQEDLKSDTENLFGGTTEGEIAEPKLPNLKAWNEGYRLQKEREVLNFYLSGHPLNQYKAHALSFSTLQLNRTDSPLIGKHVRCAGIITGIVTKLDKREQTMAIVTIEDFNGKANILFWSDAYSRYQHFLQNEKIILVRGKSELNGEQLKIIADDAMLIEDAPTKFGKGYIITIEDNAEVISKIKELNALMTNGGMSTLHFRLMDSTGELKTHYVATNQPIACNHEISEQIMSIFGRGNLRFLMD
jgi:DNA polymerase-3 subunit alpha